MPPSSLALAVWYYHISTTWCDETCVYLYIMSILETFDPEESDQAILRIITYRLCSVTETTSVPIPGLCVTRDHHFDYLT